MNDYISREAAIEQTCYNCTENQICSKSCDDTDRILAIPPANVRPVILCKDCDLWNEWDHAGRQSLGNYRCSCAHWSHEDGPVYYTAPEDFCSYAEPKDESDDHQM